MEKYIIGINKINVFFSEQNGYSINKIQIQETNEDLNAFQHRSTGGLLTVCGYFPSLEKNTQYKFYGSFIKHPKYGLQYQVETFEQKIDDSIEGLVEYLSSDLFLGIGKKIASNIVTTIGLDCINKILKDKSVLDEVSKLSEKKKEVLYKGLIQNKGYEKILIKLYSYHITPKMAMKIYNFYGEETSKVIEENPYKLIEDIEGVGFKRADEIGRKMGFSYDNPFRIKAAIIYLISLFNKKFGHTFIKKEQLVQNLIQNLTDEEFTICENVIDKFILELIDEKKIISEDDNIFIPRLYYGEINIAKKVIELSNFTNNIDDNEIDVLINKISKDLEIEYTKRQRFAIKEALKNQIMVLTGGPGTGKTTVINGIVLAYSKMFDVPLNYNNKDIVLIAPTGRAAKRMSESTNLEAKTIHKFLGYSFDGKFTHSKDNKVSAKLIIIDESSMIDVFLANQFFVSLNDDVKVIIVGDNDQLPSVGPGQVLKDIIDSDFVNVVSLDKIHRQAMDSTIISLAHDVKNGILTDNILNTTDDRSYIRCDMFKVNDTILKVINQAVNKGYDLKSDIQVLVPMYKGVAGIDNINKNIQKKFNSDNLKEIIHGDRVFRINDKVLQLVNQPEDNIMNGDQGEVIGITSENKLIVNFSGKEIEYSTKDLINLSHAYCISIHKSQGSEYPIVIMPIVKSYSIMLKRKLIYTAITRAKSGLVIIGELEALKYGIEKVEDSRQTRLKELLKSLIGNEYTIYDKDIPFDKLGEINMENVTPYDFMD